MKCQVTERKALYSAYSLSCKLYLALGNMIRAREAENLCILLSVSMQIHLHLPLLFN